MRSIVRSWTFLILVLFGSSTFAAESADKIATFGGGCFWCMESEFQELPGVKSVVSGYSGGNSKNPSYQEVSSGESGHLEVVQIAFDPKKVSYERLLNIYWRNIDPTDENGQFVDRGSQYRPVIFTHDDSQKAAALKSKEALAKSGKFSKPIVVAIEPFKSFTAAESFHQDYFKTNESHYKSYRKNSGRDEFLKKNWNGKSK